MVSYIEYLKIPTQVAVTLVIIFFIMQVIGEILSFRGKVVPAIMNIRRYFSQKKREKAEAAQMMKDVHALLSDVNSHYSADNIAKRNDWMNWVNDRAAVYDDSIDKLREAIDNVVSVLKDNTKMTEEMFVQSSRDRIIDFATKVENKNAIVSREEFNRIFKVYDKYEQFLEDHNMTNGEIDINFQIIKESYEEHLHNHTFIEDVRGYNK